MQKDILLAMIIFMIMCSMLFISDKAAPVSQKVNAVITMPEINLDLIDTKKGTVTMEIDTELYQNLLAENHDQDVKYIILFTSKVIPQLQIRYNLKEKVFESGVPEFKSIKTEFLTGGKYILKYEYKLGKLQKLYLNDNLIGQAPFMNTQGNAITGFVTINR